MVKYTIVELSKWNNLTLNAFNSINSLFLRPRGKMPVSVNILEINWVHVGRLTELLFFYFLFLPICYTGQGSDFNSVCPNMAIQTF